MKHSNLGKWVGVISLILATLAFVPSVSAFTPAILLTLFAFIGATIAALLGSLRLAVLTFFIVSATFILASQSWRGVVQMEYLVVAFATMALVFGAALYGQYKK